MPYYQDVAVFKKYCDLVITFKYRLSELDDSGIRAGEMYQLNGEKYEVLAEDSGLSLGTEK